jgi:putative membrane protein
MTKKNNLDLTIPRRQSYAAIVLIIYKSYQFLIKQLWPFLFIFIFKGGGFTKGLLLYSFVGIASLSMVVSIIRYFRFYYYIENDELIVEKGVISKKRVSVLLNRIQNVNTEQNILHKMLNVEMLSIETAGSSKKEFEFDALSKPEIEALKNVILSNKKMDLNENNGIAEHIEENSTIFKLSIFNLLLAGITQNHLTSIGIIFGFFFWIYETGRDAGVDVNEYGEKIINYDTGLVGDLLLAGTLILVAILISMLRTTLKYYNLHFFKSNTSTYKVKSGLFRVTENAAPINKIQMVAWSHNILQKILKIYELSIRQAVSEAKELKKSFKVIGCKIQHVNQFLKDLYPTFNYQEVNNRDIDIRYFYRLLRYFSIGIILSGGFFYLEAYKAAWVLFIISIFGILNAYIYQKKKKYGVHDGFVYSKGGVYGESFALMPIYKAQALSIKQSPYQSKRGLATLVIMTASGNIKIPYILKSEAVDLVNEFLYNVETSKKNWM